MPEHGLVGSFPPASGFLQRSCSAGGGGESWRRPATVGNCGPPKGWDSWGGHGTVPAVWGGVQKKGPGRLLEEKAGRGQKVDEGPFPSCLLGQRRSVQGPFGSSSHLI